MKSFFKSVLLIATISIFTLTSCQNEETQIDDSANLKNTSPLTGLLSRVSQGSTSTDNVIDSTSCYSINLPVTVIVNNQQITITDETGYAEVQNILNEFSDDDDEVTFVFPIIITFANYGTAIVRSQDQLDDIECGVDDDIEIECLNINYPFTISYYNASTQISSTVTINNDSDLFNLLENLDDEDYVSINYPISVTNANGQQVVINNDSELENAIETAESSCDDDDDDDFDDDDDSDSDNSAISQNFIDILESGGVWHVTYFFDDTNLTSNYTGYNFVFNSNRNILAISGSNNYLGSWDAYVDDNENTLEIDFSAPQLEDLSDDWEIIEFTPTQIRLKDVSSGSGETDFLTFTKY
jgi:hypothetical protein